jgi:Putative Actinobacterial Holin-X, holin superfamily III
LLVDIMSQPSGIRRVIRDIADLCELQFELLAVDGKEAVRLSFAAIAAIIFAAIFGLAAVSGSVLALAAAFHENFDWTISSSLLAATGIAAAIAAVSGILGWSLVKKATSSLDETRSEFAENLRWIKAAIVSPEDASHLQVHEEHFNGRYSSAGRK